MTAIPKMSDISSILFILTGTTDKRRLVSLNVAAQNAFGKHNKNIRKNIFACLFSVHNTISLSRHEQVCLMRLRFERYFSHHRAMTETIKLTDKKKLRNVTN